MAKGYRTHTGKAGRGSARGKASPAASVLYGINPVEAALRAGRRRLTELLLQRGPPSDRLSRLRELTAAPGIPVSEHPAPHLQALCGSPDHQGALAIFIGNKKPVEDSGFFEGAPIENGILRHLDNRDLA